jgi:hypothetical protein
VYITCALCNGTRAGGVMLAQSIGESVGISEIIIRLESEPKIGDELSKLVSGPSCRIDCIGKKRFNGDLKEERRTGFPRGRFSRGEGGDGRIGGSLVSGLGWSV